MVKKYFNLIFSLQLLEVPQLCF